MKEEKTKKKLGMTDRRIWMSLEKTVQAKQYEPVKAIVGQSSTIPDGENSDKYYAIMLKECEEQLVIQLDNMIDE